MIAKAANQDRQYGQRDRSLALIGCIVLFCSAFANEQISADQPRRAGEYVIPANDAPPKNNFDPECTMRFMSFIENLDKLLVSDPSTIRPVHELLDRHFPVEGCNIQAAIRIAQKSRFFFHVSETRTYYVLAFDSRGFTGPMDSGFHVQITLLKVSGNSWLPAAHVNQ